MPKLFDPPIAATDEEYVALQRPEYSDLRDFMEQQWLRFEPLADNDFRTQLGSKFPQRFWELYLACTFIDEGFSVESANAGPDVRITQDGRTVWVEAIAPTRGHGPDAVPEIVHGVATCVPNEQFILRLSAAIMEKFNKYKQYLSNGTVEPNDPYVIAINAYSIPYYLNETNVPRIASAVFPIGDPYVVINRRTLQSVSQGVQYRDGIAKLNGTVIPTTSFLNEEFSGISGVIYSCTTIWNYPPQLGQIAYFIHNPLAKNHLPRGWLELGTEFWEEGQKLHKHDW